MISFQQYLSESKEDKNLHMEHLEDEVLNGGVNGTRGAINFLQSLRDMLAGHSESKVNVTTKWDGAPAIVAGINPENGKFFVATKHGFSAQTPKLNYTNADIDANHPAEGLANKLKIALKYLPELGIDSVMQGDVMFTREDIKTSTIDGQNYITFQPNTIVYAVPSDSALAKTMLAAKIGVVWHTEYNGKKIEDLKASFNIDIKHYRPSRNVWYRDAYFIDSSGTVTFTKQETDALTAILAEAGSLFRTISPRTLNQIATTETYRIPIKTWNNKKVREGQEITDTAEHVKGLIIEIEAKLNKEIIAAKKEDTRRKREIEKNTIMNFYRQNKNELKKIFDLQNILVRAKNMIIRKLQMIKQSTATFIRTDNGYKVTTPEGFVAVDKLKGNAVKLVDRLEFSFNNFNAAKAWDK